MTTTKGRQEILRQVLLRAGTKEDVYWISNALAVKGKRVVDDRGILWTVAETYNARTFAAVDLQIRTWAEFAETLDKGNRK